MESALYVRLLGGFSLIYNNQQVSSPATLRLQSLLAYLVLHRDAPQHRHHLAFLFWPDATEAQARNNLRQLLHQLRQALPTTQDFLHIDSNTLRWHMEGALRFDVAEFEEALQRADKAMRSHNLDTQQSALEQVHSLYRGELLPGCYDEWILPERERLRQCHLQALETLLYLLEQQGETLTAIQYAQHLIRCDPLREDFYRHLMHLFARNNDRASAVRIYHTCAATLQRELGVEPDPATREIYEQLLHQETPVIQSQRQPALVATPPLIGRLPEWRQLQALWQQVTSGSPHFVLVNGEAGIGKSRLTEAFLQWASQQGAVTARARSYAAEGQLSLAPVTEWLRSEGLRSKLRQLDKVWLTEIVRILPELSAERPDIEPPESVSEYSQRHRFFEALARALLVTPRPLVLWIDDLQWCDQETLEWLHFLLRFDPKAKLLVVGCAREEELPPQHPLRTLLLHLRNTTALTEILLQPLDAPETTKLAEQVAKRELDMDEAIHLYHETRGYPLFVVEMVRAGLLPRPASQWGADRFYKQAPPENAQALPPRMHAVLAGRLLQLSAPTRLLAELAATIGREFTLDLLIEASKMEVDDVVCGLDELWQKRIIREHDANSYDFTHDKLREVAYGDISAPHRNIFHRRIAQALEVLCADDLSPVCGQIASHYEQAGLIEQAIPAYQCAAGVAQRIYANEDAISLLSRSLELLKKLPAGSKRDMQERDLLLALAPLYRMTKGWVAHELERVLDRSLALCDMVGNDAQRTQVLYGLQSLYVVQAKLEKVFFITDELQALYQQSSEIGAPRYTGIMMAGAQIHLGRVSEGNEHFAQIMGSHDPDQLRYLQESQGLNYAALAQAWRSQALWCLGYPQQALDCAGEAIKLVKDLDLPFNLALTSTYLAFLQHFCATEACARTTAQEALALSNKYHAPYYRPWAAILVSYAHALAQPDERHIEHLRKAIDGFKAEGTRLRMPYFLSLLARICGKAGRIREGLTIIDEALSEARTHNERMWDAELHRQRGELLLMQGAEVEDAEAAFLRAIEIAQSQQAKSWELRATVSLARLWSTQQRSAEARQRLSALYAWFQEGFETPDLQEARNLLAQLQTRSLTL